VRKKGKKREEKNMKKRERERERERDSSMVSNIQTFRGKESIKRRRPIQDHIHQAWVIHLCLFHTLAWVHSLPHPWTSLPSDQNKKWQNLQYD
jgi:hypothetical protein